MNNNVLRFNQAHPINDSLMLRKQKRQTHTHTHTHKIETDIYVQQKKQMSILNQEMNKILFTTHYIALASIIKNIIKKDMKFTQKPFTYSILWITTLS